ncbi:MAG: RDD family protein [Planctomycetes bacterium]|nr:RDD family protein [Planctomycetota bacterium]
MGADGQGDEDPRTWSAPRFGEAAGAAGESAARLEPGEALPRAGARLVDFLLGAALASGFVLFGLQVHDDAVVGLGVLVYLYVQFFVDGASGRGPGKRLAGLQVVNASDGRPIGYLRAVLRNVTLACASVFDWIVLFMNAERRRVGDFVAGTRVVHVPRGHAPVRARGPLERGLVVGSHALGALLAASVCLQAWLRRDLQDVHVFNGLPVAVEVELGEQRVTLAAAADDAQHAVLPDVAAGAYTLRVRDAAGALVSEHPCEVRAGLDLFAVNVCGAAALCLEQIHYYDEGDAALVPEPAPRWFAGEWVVALEQVDSSFDEAPDEVYLRRGERFATRTHFDAYGAWREALWLLDEEDPQRLAEFAGRLVDLLAGDRALRDRLLEELLLLDVDVLEACVERALAQTPADPALNALQQDRRRRLGEDPAGIAREYAALADADPASADLAWLALRCRPPGEALADCEAQARRFPEHAGLRELRARGLYAAHRAAEAAPELAACAEAVAFAQPELTEFAVDALLALGRPDEAVALAMRALDGEAPDVLRSLALAARADLARGGTATSAALRDAWQGAGFDFDLERPLGLWLLAGAAVPAELDLDTVERSASAAWARTARALERSPDEGLAALDAALAAEHCELDDARLLALARLLYLQGGREGAAALLESTWLPAEPRAAALAEGPASPWAAALPWEVRAALELCEARAWPRTAPSARRTASARASSPSRAAS